MKRLIEKKMSGDVDFDVSGDKFVFSSKLTRKKIVGRSSDAKMFLSKIDSIKKLSFYGIKRYLDSIGVKYVLNDLFVR